MSRMNLSFSGGWKLILVVIISLAGTVHLACGQNLAPSPPAITQSQAGFAAQPPGQQAGASQFAKVTLQDGSTLTGQVSVDPTASMVTVTSVDSEGRRTIDYVVATFVKQLDPLPADAGGRAAISNAPPQPPVGATLYMADGSVVRGIWQPSSAPGQIALIPEGGNQPIAIPLTAVVRMSMVENVSRSAVPSPGTAPSQMPAAPPSQGAPAAQLAKVTLQDGSTLTGQVFVDPTAPMVTVVSIDSEGHRSLDYVAAPLIKQVDPLPHGAEGHGPISNAPPQPPISATLYMVDNSMVKGIWQPSPAPGQIALIPEGTNQPVAIPLVAVVRMTMLENASKGTAPSAGTPPPQGPGAPAGQGAQFAKVTLQDGSTLTGQVFVDPRNPMISVVSVDSEGHKTIDYVVAAMVKQVDPLPPDASKQVPVNNAPPKPPISATLYVADGSMVKGIWQPSPTPGQIIIVPEGTNQPVAIPLSAVVRITMIEGTPTSSASKAEPSSGISTSSTGESVYTAIPIGQLPKTLPSIPRKGSKVAVITNLGQRFTGTITLADENWVEMMVSNLGGMDLSPPQLSVISRKNITSVETIAKP